MSEAYADASAAGTSYGAFGTTPPLLSGWTEHIGPQGQLYWYHAEAQQSTYRRPTAPVIGSNGQPVYSGPPPIAAGIGRVNGGEKRKKEKPAKKEPIEGAEGWLRVTTNRGNVFYAHLPSKRSEWTVPDEIREQVERLKGEERRAEEEIRKAQQRERDRMQEAEREKATEERLSKQRTEESARLEERKRQERLDEERRRQRQEQEQIYADRQRILQEAAKRKRTPSPVQNEVDEGHAESAKRARAATPDDIISDDEQEWQKGIAAEMAVEAEEQAESPGSQDEGASLPIEDAKVVFMCMLDSLNGTPSEINPMMPWDRELPKFEKQRDYTVLQSIRDRQDAFNDWCRRRLREKRAMKAAQASTSTQSKQQADDGQPAEAKSAFRQLLEAEVKSTRTAWDDFRKLWRKDRRFYGYGRDDREREKTFRSWLRELGEKKQKAAKMAEAAFLALLSEMLGSQADIAVPANASADDASALWLRAKRTPGLDQDPRYDAVGSSSRRAELFRGWLVSQDQRKPELNDLQSGQPEARASVDERADRKKASERRDAAAQALQDRAEKVRRERMAVDRQKHHALGQAMSAESVTSFQQLLIDAIDDPLSRLPEAFERLRRDERFDGPGLRVQEKEQLFHQHVQGLNDKRLRALEQVFAHHAPTLDTEEDVALPLIEHDDEIRRRRLTDIREIRCERKSLRDVYRDWQDRRERAAKDDFMQMLKENAFVEFWGQLRQELQHKQARDKGAQAPAAEATDEDDEDANAPGLLQMAAQIDLDEIDAVLRNDARYRIWRHKPALREGWIREHLQRMTIPKMTHFQKD